MCAAEAFSKKQISSKQLRQVISMATTVKPNQKDLKIRTVRSRCLHFKMLILVTVLPRVLLLKKHGFWGPECTVICTVKHEEAP